MPAQVYDCTASVARGVVSINICLKFFYYRNIKNDHRMNFVNTILIIVAVLLLSVNHDYFSALGLGFLAFAIMPFHK